MRTALDAVPEAFDEAEQKFVTNIRELGWFRTGVFAEADLPKFSYTTGFWVNTQKPEIIMFSMNDTVVHQIFMDLFRNAKADRCLPIGKQTGDVFGNFAAYTFPVAKRYYPDYLGWSRWFYAGDDFPCLQVVWPDRAGLFPWEREFDSAFASSQPDLTENGWLAALAH
jgi:hypothetical protein